MAVCDLHVWVDRAACGALNTSFVLCIIKMFFFYQSESEMWTSYLRCMSSSGLHDLRSREKSRSGVCSGWITCVWWADIWLWLQDLKELLWVLIFSMRVWLPPSPARSLQHTPAWSTRPLPSICIHGEALLPEQPVLPPPGCPVIPSGWLIHLLCASVTQPDKRGVDYSPTTLHKMKCSFLRTCRPECRVWLFWASWRWCPSGIISV